jgi:lipopolysaccharide/colanic/teichoic acid biosynthesis glycosyltransferase
LFIIAILIKIESKGPIFYLQDRVGKGGKIFKIFKLRTMYIDKETDKNAFCSHENDPRITKMGQIIRPCSLDEFPQFINVLKGDLSYIGPRPISLEEHNFVLEELQFKNKEIPQGLIPIVNPGITGWALLHGRANISYEDRFKLNSQYENNISLKFDLKIFFMTFKKYAFTNILVFTLFLSVVIYLFL